MMSNTFLLFLGIIGFVSSASISVDDEASTEASSSASASTEAVSLENLVTGIKL